MKNPLSIRTPDESGDHKLDWNKVLDLGIKIITLATLVYCVKHGINTELQVQKVEHKADSASNLVAAVAVKVESNATAVAVVREVQMLQNTAPYQAALESMAVENVENANPKEKSK